MSWTIQQIYDDGRIDVLFDYDNQVQNLAGKTVTDAAVLQQELDDYESAYIDGLEQDQVSVDPAVQSMVRVSSAKLSNNELS